MLVIKAVIAILLGLCGSVWLDQHLMMPEWLVAVVAVLIGVVVFSFLVSGSPGPHVGHYS